MEKVFLAHRDKERIETIREHSERCLNIFNRVDKEYKIRKKLIKTFSSVELTKKIKGTKTKLSNSEIDFLLNAFINVIMYHDAGKINPKFQRDKMKSDIMGIENIESMESLHSKISVAIYINEMFSKIEKEKFNEKLFLKRMVLLFSNIILNHHGELKAFNKEAFKSMIGLINSNNYLYYYKEEFTLNEDSFQCIDKYERLIETDEMVIFIICRMLEGMLILCDFVATYLFFNPEENFEINNLKNQEELIRTFNSTPIVKGIEEYSKNKVYFRNSNLPLINEVRSEIFLESIYSLRENNEYSLYNLEAPTGSGKTYASLGLIMEVLKANKNIFKNIIYTFPMNSISIQSYRIISSIFDSEKVGLVQEFNSITPIQMKYDKNGEEFYSKALLDRQTYNSPIVLTSNIGLFNILFGTSRESALGVFKLFDSIIVLDEIQNYKNDIWMEMIEFVKKYADIFNIKFIIMSATLPNLDKLLNSRNHQIFNLIRDTKVYYENPLFKNRVNIDYSLIKKKVDFNILFNKMVRDISIRDNKLNCKSKYIIEFIKKQTAKDYYSFVKERLKDYEIYELDGDDNLIYKDYVIARCATENPTKDIILITTQVIECGVDIDMDLGAKDCVFPDCDEQFIGRINRSCTKELSTITLFNMDNEKDIYLKDNRVGTNVKNDKFLKVLINKEFNIEYEYVLNKIQTKKTQGLLPLIKDFNKLLLSHNYPEIQKHMRLIDDNTIEIFIPTIIEIEDRKYDGYKTWKNFLETFNNEAYSFEQKKVLLSQCRRELSMFTFNVHAEKINWMEPICGIYFLKDGEKFLTNGKFDSDKFKFFSEYYL